MKSSLHPKKINKKGVCMNYKFKPGMYVKIHGGEYDGLVGKILNEASVYEEPVYCVLILTNEIDIRCDQFECDLERTFQEKFELNIFDDYDADETYGCLTIPGGFSSIRLAIWPSEGDGYPHFHFYKGVAPNKGIPKEKKNGGGCICFESANYFKHDKHVDTMTPQEIRELIKFLKTPMPEYNGIILWKHMLMSWNANNEDRKQLSLNLEIPEYYSYMPTVQVHARTKKK